MLFRVFLWVVEVFLHFGNPEKTTKMADALQLLEESHWLHSEMSAEVIKVTFRTIRPEMLASVALKSCCWITKNEHLRPLPPSCISFPV